MQAARKLEERYTYADYCAWPEDERWELIDGAAYALATPTFAHQNALMNLAGQLYNFLRGKPCNVFVAPFSVRLNADEGDDTVVEPDILVVCDHKKLEDGKGVVGAPDFIVEILLPSTAKHDRERKYKLYQKAGVREYWVVDPDDKLLMAYVLRDGRYLGSVFFEDDESVPVEVLEGCTINLTEVFEGLRLGEQEIDYTVP